MPDSTGGPDLPVVPGDGDTPQVPTSAQAIYLDDETVAVPTGGLFLVSEFTTALELFTATTLDFNGDGFDDLLVYSQSAGVRMLFGRARV